MRRSFGLFSIGKRNLQSLPTFTQKFRQWKDYESVLTVLDTLCAEKKFDEAYQELEKFRQSNDLFAQKGPCMYIAGHIRQHEWSSTGFLKEMERVTSYRNLLGCRK